MIRPCACAFLVSGALLAQSSNDVQPKFVIADIHPSTRPTSPMGRFFRGATTQAGRYEAKNASMVDLIRIGYGFQPDKILGGPSWLEMDHFDIIAKLPSESAPTAQKEMLQSLLAERFRLVVHKDTKPLPTFALTVGKKLQLREPDKSDQTGCKAEESSGAPVEGGIRGSSRVGQTAV